MARPPTRGRHQTSRAGSTAMLMAASVAFARPWLAESSKSYRGSARIAASRHPGEMAEWFKAHAWNACVRESVPWVRIPLSPPDLVAWGRTKSQFPLRTQRSSASLVLGGRIKAHAMLYMDCASSSAYLYIEGSNYADGCAIGILPQRSPRPLPLRLAHGRTLLAVPLSVAGTRADPRPRRISDTLARPCAAADQLADPGTGFGSNRPWILTEVFCPIPDIKSRREKQVLRPPGCSHQSHADDAGDLHGAGVYGALPWVPAGKRNRSASSRRVRTANRALLGFRHRGTVRSATAALRLRCRSS
jgi:hypothetical protein